MVTREQLRSKPFGLNDEKIEWVESTLRSLTLEEKAGQLFCLTAFTDEDAYIDRIFSVMQPGGIMYRPMESVRCVEMTNKLNRRGKVPLLVAANLESGASGAITDGTYVGTQLQIAATDDPAMAGKMGAVCAEEAGAAGFNWAFAPILDVDLNWRNPITNVRTFGSDPERVRAMAKAYVEAVESRGMAVSIKHFPGDGVDERDQHLVTSINSLSCEEWDEAYGKTYAECIAAGARTVMVGHIMQPAYSRRLNPSLADEELLPASLSPELLQGLLRGKLGFNGLIVTDATVMGGFTIPMERRKAVPRAIAAGNDMFLFCRDMAEDFQFMLDGVRDGVLTEERLDEAVTRILALKASLGLTGEPLSASALAGRIGTAEHRAWRDECADRSVTLVKEEPGVLPLDARKRGRMLLVPIEQEAGFFAPPVSAVALMRERLEREGFKVTLFETNGSYEGMLGGTEEMARRFDVILYVANLATRSNQTVVRIEWAMPMGANLPIFMHQVPTIFVSVANPYHLVDAPRVKTYVNAYSADGSVLDALVDKLMGRSPFKGQSPVDAFCGKWDTRL